MDFYSLCNFILEENAHTTLPPFPKSIGLTEYFHKLALPPPPTHPFYYPKNVTQLMKTILFNAQH